MPEPSCRRLTAALGNMMQKRVWRKARPPALPSVFLPVFLPALLSLLLSAMLTAGCGRQPVIGPLDDQASVALIRYESQEDGLEGVVYRRVNRLDALLAQSEVPVLVVFYQALAAENSLIIPRLEQMADDLRDTLQIVWIDAGAEPALAASFKAEKLPQFTVVVEAVLKRSLIGYDSEGAVRLRQLIEPYLK